MLKLVKRPKSPFWIARGTINGRRVEVSTGETGKSAAKLRLPAIVARHSAGEIGEDGLRFDQAVAIYVQEGGDQRFLEPITRHFAGVLVSEITNAEMRRAANILYPGRKPDTIRRQLYTPVKAILNCAAEEDLCTVPRLKSPKGGNKRLDFMLPEQADRLITELAKGRNQYLPPLVTFLIGQGARVGEALQIEGTDVSLEHRIATLRDTKNGEERTVTLIPRVIAALSVLPTIGQRGPVFRRLDGMPYRIWKNQGGQIGKPFRRAVVASGMDPERITPHICRHTFGTWFYNQTKDVQRLKHEGGWKSAEWERYTKIVSQRIGIDALRHGWDFREKAAEMPGIGGHTGEYGIRC